MLSTPGSHESAASHARRWRGKAIAVVVVGLLVSLFAMYLATPEPWSSAPVSLLSYGAFQILVVVALVGLALAGPGMLAVRVRRTGPTREHGPRPHWPVALTLPLLVTTSAYPFVTPGLWHAPAHFLALGVVAAAGAAWLTVTVMRRLLTWRWSRADLHPEQMASTRRASLDRIERAWEHLQAALHRAESHGAPRRRISSPQLRAPGDRDMHLEVDTDVVTVRIFDGLIQLVADHGWIPDALADRIRDETPLELQFGAGATIFLSARDPDDLHTLGSTAASIIRRWEDVPELDSDAPLAGDSPAEAELTEPAEFIALQSNGTHVSWAFDGESLVVADTNGMPVGRIDLGRKFRLFVAVSPEDSAEPRLLVTIRQRGQEPGAASSRTYAQTDDGDGEADGVALDDGRVGLAGGEWEELALAVPLRWRDTRLEHLPTQTLDAPALAQPHAFVGIWKRLFWRAIDQGAQPPRLPSLPLGYDRSVDETHHDVIGPSALTKGASAARFLWPVAFAGAAAVTIASLWGTFAQQMIVFPYWESPDLSPALWGLTVPALVLGALLLQRDSLRRYVDGATRAVLDLIEEACGVDVDDVGVTMTGVHGSLRRFARRGEPVEVHMALDKGLTATLTIWPAGYRGAGLTIAEQLELHARTVRGAARDWHHLLSELYVAIGNLDARASLDDNGGERVLSMQTRRVVGSGRGVWVALEKLFDQENADPTSGDLPSIAALDEPDDASDLEERSQLLMDIGRLQPPILPLPGRTAFTPLLRRPLRGLKYGAAVAAVALLPFAMPHIDSDAHPVAEDAPDATLLEQCPRPELVGTPPRLEVYDFLDGYRCALNASGRTERVIDSPPSRHFKALPGETAGGHWARACSEIGELVDRAARPGQLEFNEAMLERHQRQTMHWAWDYQVWGIWPEEQAVDAVDPRLDVKILIERGVDCVTRPQQDTDPGAASDESAGDPVPAVDVNALLRLNEMLKRTGER